jgi:eukaryotic-like serine/threonine-protein kinase
MTPDLIAGRYELQSRLGHGGMATVYLATDRELRRPVALKLLADNLAGDDTLRRRFKREARLAAKLDHPNVVQVYDVGEQGEQPFIVMEYVDGGTLAERLDGPRGLPARERLSLLQQMCEGLAHAHDRGLVHRDIKPQNLLIRSTDGCLKIADFGIARAVEETRLTQTGRVVGTDRYMAPEQLYDGRITPATDVYACGVVADETLSERRRPPEITEIIDRCLSEDPGDRFDDAGALGEALGGTNGTLAPTRPLVDRVRSDRGRARPRPTRGTPATRPVVALEAETAALRRRRSPSGKKRGRRAAELAALVALAAIVAVVIIVAGSGGSDDSGGEAQGSGQGSAPAVEPAPRLTDPGEQAEAFSQWLREQGR